MDNILRILQEQGDLQQDALKNIIDALKQLSQTIKVVDEKVDNTRRVVKLLGDHVGFTITQW